MANDNTKIPSNGSLIVEPNGRVLFSGSPTTDENQVVTYNKRLQTIESTSLSVLAGLGGSGEVTISPTPPSNPVPGDLWWNSIDGRLFIYYDDGNTSQWVDASPNGGGTGTVTIGPNPPSDAMVGDLWWNSTTGRLYIYYDDPDGLVWVDASPNGGGAGTANVIISPNAPTGATPGDLWWNSEDGRLFVYYVDPDDEAVWVDASPNGGSTGTSNVAISTTTPTVAEVGDLWWNSIDGRLFIYYSDPDGDVWVDASPNGGSDDETTNVGISTQPPTNAVVGDLWWNSEDGRLFIYYDDPDGPVWVDASPNGGQDETLVGISTNAPTPGVEGQLWWNSDEGRLYIYYTDINGSQWVDASPNGGGADDTDLQQQISDLEARIAALEGN